MKRVATSALVLLLACKKEPAPTPPPETEVVSTLSSTSPTSKPEGPPPRCRIDGRDLPLGEGTVVGDAIVRDGKVHLGVARDRKGAILAIPFDLSKAEATELGPVVGEDPPPSPRFDGKGVTSAMYAAWKEAGTTRDFLLGGKPAATQQADESTAFDIAFPKEGAAAIAWDEDAPIPQGQLVPERGQIRVQLAGDKEKARVASPYTSDADAPRLANRKGGFWLAWVAKKIENPDAGDAPEGPGEKRAFRWIEIVALDSKANPIGTPKRITPANGRIVSFDLVENGQDVVAIAQDEAALSDGAGGRIVRYAIDDKGDAKGQDLLEGGVGHAIADIVSPWIAWTDVTEHAHILPITGGPSTREPLLDGARVVAAEGDRVFAVVAVPSAPGQKTPGSGLVLRGFACTNTLARDK